jgi:hypothetical protein
MKMVFFTIKWVFLVFFCVKCCFFYYETPYFESKTKSRIKHFQQTKTRKIQKPKLTTNKIFKNIYTNIFKKN